MNYRFVFILTCLVFFSSGFFTWQSENMEKLSPNLAYFFYAKNKQFYYGWHCSFRVPHPNSLWLESYRPAAKKSPTPLIIEGSLACLPTVTRSIRLDDHLRTPVRDTLTCCRAVGSFWNEKVKLWRNLKIKPCAFRPESCSSVAYFAAKTK